MYNIVICFIGGIYLFAQEQMRLKYLESRKQDFDGEFIPNRISIN